MGGRDHSSGRDQGATAQEVIILAHLLEEGRHPGQLSPCHLVSAMDEGRLDGLLPPTHAVKLSNCLVWK